MGFVLCNNACVLCLLLYIVINIHSNVYSNRVGLITMYMCHVTVLVALYCLRCKSYIIEHYEILCMADTPYMFPRAFYSP